jgi:hypothetical protein
MPLGYNSDDWRKRAEEARILAGKMKKPEAINAMNKVAEEYERLRRRRALDEAMAAFGRSRRALRDTLASESVERQAEMRVSCDEKRSIVEQAQDELDAHIRAFPELTC